MSTKAKPALRETEQLTPDELLACKFFMLYSKFEFALKALDCAKANSKKNPWVRLDWKKFASRDEVKNALADTVPPVDMAIEFLVKRPACRQIVKDHKVVWEERPPADSKGVLEVIAIVRNNLVHGGKFNSTWLPSFGDANRDAKAKHYQLGSTKLYLEHSMTVLNHIRDHDPKLKRLISEASLGLR